MAYDSLICDRDSETMRATLQALDGVRRSRDILGQRIAGLTHLINGDGSQDVHYAPIASAGGFQTGGYATTNAAARAHWDELNSLYSKLSKPSGQGDETGAAIDQACAKHGV